jgi:hypothetical protein
MNLPIKFSLFPARKNICFATLIKEKSKIGKEKGGE